MASKWELNDDLVSCDWKAAEQKLSPGSLSPGPGPVTMTL